MQQLLHHVFLPAGMFRGTEQERRSSFLKRLLLLAGLATLPFYVIYHPDYDPLTHVVGAMGYWVLLALLVAGVPYLWMAHTALLWSVIYVAYLVASTGGINSPAMVWMVVILLPAVLLLNFLPALLWIGVAWCVSTLLLWWSQVGDGGVQVSMTHEAVLWALTNKVFAGGVAMYVVYATERMYRAQQTQVSQSNEQLEAAQRTLVQVQAYKEEFIAAISHELRTPMNAILGLNGVLRQEMAANPKDVELVDHIRTATEQLLQVVNDILDFSQLQAGKIQCVSEPFYLYAGLLELMAVYAQQAEKKGIAFKLEADPFKGVWVRGDRRRVLQIIQNLVDNAFKFTPQGEVSMSAQWAPQGIRFEVRDTGKGIPADRQPHLLEGVSIIDREHGGVGLGLPLCDRLVKLQNGRMGLCSQPGKGTQVWFELPLEKIHMNEGAIPYGYERRMVDYPLRILLVDDHPVNLWVAMALLKKSLPCAVVVEANNGDAALLALRAQPFDVVLMDVVMPGMDGLTLTRHLRQDFPSPVSETPVLALTASNNPVDHERCLLAGMNGVVLKPIDAQQLVSKIASVCLLQP